MRELWTQRTSKAKRRLALLLLVAFAGLGAGAIGVFAAPAPDFSLAPSPAGQTVGQGQSASYTITVSRTGGFAGSVSLSASLLPKGASASFALADGTSTNVVPAGVNSVILTVRTAATTPNGTSYPVVVGTSAKLVRATAVTLVVQPSSQPGFTLAPTPASRTVVQSDATSYQVRISRTGGFSGPVSLSVWGVPPRASVSWSPAATVPGSAQSATLTVDSDRNTPAGSYTLVVIGTGTVAGRPALRFAAVGLVVAPLKSFQISGDLSQQLYPGTRAPLDLKLTNPYGFALKVTNLAVAVEEGTSKPACSGTQNFRIVPAGGYPYTLPPGSWKLSQLVADSSKWPQVEMRETGTDQDACKGARVALDYQGSATK